MNASTRWPVPAGLRRRGVAAGLHFLLSLVVALLTALLVLWLWFPSPYDVLAGGRGLFWLVVSVDVVMGPLLTFVVFNQSKPRQELVRDLAIIGLLQVTALAYGLHTVYQVRPVALVFETDRFRVVTAFDVRMEELPQARPEFRALPLTDRWLLGTRASNAGEERLQAIDLALKGYDVGQRPSYWQPYDDSRASALERARPATALLKQYPQAQADLQQHFAELGLSAESAKFLPVTAREQGWSVLLKPNGDIAGFVPYDGFF
jgi:hypothetical protein